MNKQSIAFAISATASLFLLAACADTTVPATTSTATSKTTISQTQSTTNAEEIKEDQNASLTISGTQQSETLKEQVEDPKDIKTNETLYAEILTSRKEERCKELTIDRFIRDCELNILINKAVEAKDSTICNKASTDRNQADCKTQYEMSTNLGPAPSN